MERFHYLHTGEIYFSNDEELNKLQKECLEYQYQYNLTSPSESLKRKQLLTKMFAKVGEGTSIEPPIRANWGGHFVHLGKQVYINFNLTLVDDTYIYIGDHTMIGPNVTIDAGTHPISPRLREKVGQYNLPVHIGKNVWIGAGVIILPGVTIGDHSIIGAGSVVTRDIPERVIAFGSPCKVIRDITEE